MGILGRGMVKVTAIEPLRNDPFLWEDDIKIIIGRKERRGKRRTSRRNFRCL